MAHDRKYAALPDLDSAPDIYETQEPAPRSPSSRTSTPHTTSSLSPSPSASDNDGDGDEHHQPRPSRISRRAFSPRSARTHFRNTRVDASGADFSDRLGDRAARSYKVSKQSRRRRRRDVYEDFGDGEDGLDESLEERVARLRREVEEVRVAAEEKGEADRVADGAGTGAGAGVEELSRVLKELSTRSERPRKGAPPQPNGAHKTAHADASQPPPSTSPAPITQEPQHLQGTLARAATLESRLTQLETALGLPQIPFSSSASASPPKPLLTTVSLLEAQLGILSQTFSPSSSHSASASAASPSTAANNSLERISSNLQRLTREAQALETSRQKATQALREKQTLQQQQAQPSRSRPTSSFSTSIAAPGVDPDTGLQAEQVKRIEKLHDALPTVESLAPLLPAVLERLKSLRRIHADAGAVWEGFREVERRQGECWEELRKWRGAVERFEGAVSEGESRSKENGRVVEDWVKGLEERVGQLEEGKS